MKFKTLVYKKEVPVFGGEFVQIIEGDIHTCILPKLFGIETSIVSLKYYFLERLGWNIDFSHFELKTLELTIID